MAQSRIPLAVPDLRGNEAAYLTRCVEDNWVSSAGPYVVELEKRMAALTGQREGIATVNGTTALHLALVLAGVGPGDLVIVPDWTFAATANAVIHAGAEPFFIDITRDSWTLDPELTEKAIEQTARQAGRRVAAVIVVHSLGHPAKVEPLMACCKQTGIPLIEDAAGAIGARYGEHPVGSFGEAAVFSFNGNKTVTAGGGGMIVTDSEDWAGRAKLLSTQSRSGRAYRYDEVGFNYRMPNINAALGLAQLERMEEMVRAKRVIAAGYDAALADRADLIVMPRAKWAESSCWLYSVRCATREDAASLVAHLDAAGIETRLFWEALSEQTPYEAFPALRTGVAEALSGAVVSLPCSSHISEAEQSRVVDGLADWRGHAVRAAA